MLFFKSAQKRKTPKNQGKQLQTNINPTINRQQQCFNYLKNYLSDYIKSKLKIKSAPQEAVILKQQTIEKIERSSQNIDNTIYYFVQLLQKIYDLKHKPLFTNINKIVAQHPQDFYQKFQQQYMNLVEQNLRIKQEMSQNYQRNIFRIKQLESTIDKLQNENFTLKNKLEKKSNKCLVLQLQKNKCLDDGKNFKNHYYSPRYRKLNQQQLKTNRSKSPFDFRPCIQLWNKQGIHKDRIKDLINR